MHTAGDTGLSHIMFHLDVCPTYLHEGLGADNCSLGQRPLHWNGGNSGVSLPKLRGVGVPHTAAVLHQWKQAIVASPGPVSQSWGE